MDILPSFSLFMCTLFEQVQTGRETICLLLICVCVCVHACMCVCLYVWCRMILALYLLSLTLMTALVGPEACPVEVIGQPRLKSMWMMILVQMETSNQNFYIHFITM